MISLSGYSLLAAILILTVMIAPIMISIFCDGLRAVRPGWLEGSLALGVNRWRTFWKIAVRTARPAIVAGTVLATARALGEAVMLAMVSGSVGFAPNPADGLIFFFEPSRPLAPTIIKSIDSLGSPPANATLFAIAAVLLFSAAMFSLIAWVAKRQIARKTGLDLMEASGARTAAPRARATPTGRGRVDRRLAADRPARARVLLGARASLFCAIAAAIVIYMLVQGLKYVSLELLTDAAEGRLQPGHDRRLPRPADRDRGRRRDGDGDRAAGRDRDRRLAVASTGARWRSRGSPSRRSR